MALNISDYIIIGSIVVVALILLLLAWRTLREYRKAASWDEDEKP
ncbi:MAG: hypothetical protein ABEK59_00590 [Halobacteria archaeon]